MARAWARWTGFGRAAGGRARCFAALLVAAMWAMTLATPVARAAESPLTVVMDGSGSMWGKIGSERLAKFQLARQGLAEALPKLSPATPLGLVAFGHRRAGCQDVEVLRAPEAGDTTRVVDLLAEFNPRGRGPITAGLQSALETMPKGGAGTILLIHDDLDNCQQNPCSLLGEIRSQYPRVVVHVVSIGMSPAEAPQMQCLTTATGGQHYLATTGAQVTSAIAEVIDIVSRPVGPVARAETAPRETVTPIGPGLHLIASLGPTVLAPDLPVRWRVERLGAGDAAIQRQQGGAVTVPLVPGRYAITAELDLLSVRQEIDVADVASMRVQLALAGGTLRLAAIAGRLNKPLDGTRFVIRPAGTAASADKPVAPVWVARGSRAEIALPEGRYEVVVTHGSTRIAEEAAVVVGERRALDARLAVGELELATLQSENGNKLEQVVYVIQEDDPDAAQGRREVARSAAAQPVFALPAGTYHVIATHGAAEVRDRVAIGAGEVVRRDLVLNSAELSLASGLVARLAADSDEVQWRIVPLERRDAKVVRAYGTAAKVVLGAGRYRVEARFGPLNAQASREIAIAPGAQDTVSLTPAAARVRLRLAPVQGEPPGEVFWKVRLASGAIVWSSTESEPLGLLQQGTYVIEAQTRQGRHEQSAEVRAGADRVVVVGEN